MNLRDWLFLIGAVILIVIVLDGVRRMRQAKRDSLQMSRDMGGTIEESPLDDFNPELPSGGARIVERSGDDASADHKPIKMAKPLRQEPAPRPVKSSPAAPVREAAEPAQVSEHKTAPKISIEPETASFAASAMESMRKGFMGGVAAKASKLAGGKLRSTAVEEPKAPQGPLEVIVINVDSRDPEQSFQGVDLKHLLEACGLVHGEMSIFHRHEEDDLLSPLQFSVANGVEPGYFDPAQIEELETPSVSFFMSLPGPRDSLRAFEYMLETAQCFARNLGGELRDENRSVMTAQTIEHCRQRVKEFERKQLSRTRTV